MKQFFNLQSSFLRKKAGAIVGYILILVALCLFASSARGLEITNRLFDNIRTTSVRQEAIIIGIDDKSLQALGAWPWNREVFAQLIEKLEESGTRVSVFDVLFFEPREGDERLKGALDASTHTIILASKLEQGEYLSSYLTEGSTSTINALANVDPDSDGKVRVYPGWKLHNGECVLSLSEQAFASYTRKESNLCTANASQFRYPEGIPAYSLIDVMNGNVAKELLQDKVAFIGSTSLGLEDHFVGMRGDKVPGVYVHASAFTSRLNEISDRPATNSLSWTLIATFMLLSAGAFYVIKRLFLQVFTILVLLLGAIVLSIGLFSQGYILSLPAVLASVLVTAGYTALVRFIEAREQNLFIEQLFSKYVHKDVLKELLVSGKEISLGGERKQLTILFSDLRGFTTLSESMSPEKLTTILNNYLSAMTPCVLEEKGTIDKFIGDAIMAFWNAPLDVENHSLHAVISALRMHKTLAYFNGVNNTSLAVGIGIHAGPAIVGNVGGKDRVNYTVLGDTVNLASRIEGLTKKYGVGTIVTKAVRDEITDEQIAFRCLDVITVLGKSTPTTLYEVRYKDDFASDLVKKYEKALKHYYDGEWDKAEAAFKKLVKEGDLPSEKMLARIPQLREKTDWDGVWRFDEK